MSRTAWGGRTLRRLAAGAVVVLPVALGMPAAGEVAPVAPVAPCTGRAMQVVAHEDDDLLFMNPDVRDDVARGLCVRTVYLTAGDAGRGPRYWRGREAGERAAYARMAGVADRWSTATVPGSAIRLQTLVANPNVSLVFLRLPDGNVTGDGFARTGHASLERLWDGDVASIASLDPAPVTYTKASLVATLAGLIADFAPGTLRVQDAHGSFEHSEDHPDHLAAARLATEAQASYRAPHTLVQYEGYGTAHRPPNVAADDLAGKKAAFYAYSAHDAHACRSDAACTGRYGLWLRRQYVLARTFIGG